MKGLTEFQVQTFEECIYLLQRGEKSRLIRETRLNTKSSRSHIIFQIRMECNQEGNGKLKRSKFCLCDLAGSEKMPDDLIGQHKGNHFAELKYINLSLTTLGKVIHNLSHNKKLPVPYRESALTRILQESLSGAGKTYILANLAPCTEFVEDTMNT